MKYSELISFSPIESTLQLIQSNSNKAEEINNIKTYVMSEGMAQSMKAPVIDQLQMDEVVDNKGVLIVGNHGTGKSHLMSVIPPLLKMQTICSICRIRPCKRCGMHRRQI